MDPTPPLRRHRCIEDPHTRAGPSACTNPCSRRHTNQDPRPPGPAVTPTGGRAPPDPQTPPRTNPGTVRPPGWHLRPPAQASPAAPHAAARETASKSHQYPIQAKAAAQRRPPQETHPQGTPRCPRPILPPHANNKTTAGQNRDPHPH